MKLEEIGFYTLSDRRVEKVSSSSPMQRGEIVLGDACNLKCTYCKGLRADCSKAMSTERAMEILDLWAMDGLRNVRFSGGEPTTYPKLLALVAHAKDKGVKRIAISTNGTAPLENYDALLAAGLNDISISLDTDNAALGDAMVGGVAGYWDRAVEAIKYLAQRCYVTIGAVLTHDNSGDIPGLVEFISGLGVADIRIIPAAQNGAAIDGCAGIPNQTLERHPILKYRATNAVNGKPVRGLSELDSRRCALVLDDSACAGQYHFPCIIYLREKGEPIGKIGPLMREERVRWFREHDTFTDPICKVNCIDVCVEHNNAVMRRDCGRSALDRMDSSLFDWRRWRIGCEWVAEFGFECRYNQIVSPHGKEIMRAHAVGWSPGGSLPCRPKSGHVGVMFWKGGRHFWTHLRENEFTEIWRETAI